MLNNRLNEYKIGTAIVVVDILPKGKVIPNTKITPTSICFHQTGNVDASAKANHNYMKKDYQSPSTTVLAVETAILCASGGASFISPKGSLESIGKC